MTKDAAQSLWGRITPADTGAALGERSIGATNRDAVVGALPGEKRSSGDIMAATERAVAAAAGVAYRPKTRETAAAWADVLAIADDLLGWAAPRDAVYAAADEALAIFNAAGRSDTERRAMLCAVFGNDTLNQEEIIRLFSAARRVTDYGAGTGGGSESMGDVFVAAPTEEPYSSDESEESADETECLNVDALARTVAARMDRRSAAQALAAPEGAARVQLPGGHEEVRVPPASALPPPIGTECVRVCDLPPWMHAVLGASSTLNRMQSAVLPSALGSDAPLLVSAPTGAGKTTVALLAMLRSIGLSRGLIPCDGTSTEGGKIVYIAPMRALVAEAARTFSEQLAPLGVRVVELTGDTTTSPALLAAAGVVVATPEKWDVVTRKTPSETATAAAIGRVSLVIVDEVHLLDDSSRGPVLEAVVVRARLASCRVLGLSATLPNHGDVGRFLGCAPADVFHFGPSHRPCPLALSVVAVCASSGGALRQPLQRMRAMDEVAADAVLERLAVSSRRQALVFVHARRETVRFARFLRDRAEANGLLSVLVGVEPSAPRGVGGNMPNDELAPFGIATHHAGMDREARVAAEAAFARGSVRVLVATATLAWGVNLPAHTVVIRGTQVYDASRGAWADLSPQDALQMLGRAGRPQYDTSGSGVVVTAGGRPSLARYVSLLTAQAPVESRLLGRVCDVLLAEVCAGRIRSLSDAVRYLSLTFLAVRALEEPALYGVGGSDFSSARLDDDGGSGGDGKRRTRTVEEFLGAVADGAFVSLCTIGLIVYRPDKSAAVTALGRLAAHYYVSPAGIKALSERVGAHTTHADVIAAFAGLPELAALRVRAEERTDLDALAERMPFPVDIFGDDEDTGGAKAALLLQAHVSRAVIAGHALASDCATVRQSAARVLRAIFALALDRGHHAAAVAALDVCRWVLSQQWPAESPLWQLAAPADRAAVASLERMDGASVAGLADKDAAELGEYVRSPQHGEVVRRLLDALPLVGVSADIRPVCREIVSFDVRVALRGTGCARAIWLLVSAPLLADGTLVIVSHRRVTLTAGSERVLVMPGVLPRAVVPADRSAVVFHVHALVDDFVGCDVSSALLVEGRCLGERMAERGEGLVCSYDVSGIDLSACRTEPLRSLAEAVSSRSSLVVNGALVLPTIAQACMLGHREGLSPVVVTCHGPRRVSVLANALEAHGGAEVRSAGDTTVIAALTLCSAGKVFVVEGLGCGSRRANAAAEMLLSAAVRAGVAVVLVNCGLPWGDGLDIAHWLRASAVNSARAECSVCVVSFEDAMSMADALFVSNAALPDGGSALRCIAFDEVYSRDMCATESVVLVVSSAVPAADTSRVLAFVAAMGCAVSVAPLTHGDAKLAELLASAPMSSLPIESALADVFGDVVLALIVSRQCTAPADVMGWLNDTLLVRRMQRNPRLYGASSASHVPARLSALVDEALGELVEAGMAERSGENYTPTQRGLLAAHHGLSVQTAEMAALTLEAALSRGTAVGVRGVLEMAAASREAEEAIGHYAFDDETDVHDAISTLSLRSPYRVPRGHLLSPRPLASVLLQSLLVRSDAQSLARLRSAVYGAAVNVIRALVDMCGASLLPAKACVHALQHMRTGTREGDSPLLQLAPVERGDASALRGAIARGNYSGHTLYDVDGDVLRALFAQKEDRKAAALVVNGFPALAVDSVRTIGACADGQTHNVSVRVSCTNASGSVGATEAVWFMAVSAAGDLLSARRVVLGVNSEPIEALLAVPAVPAKLLVLCEDRIGADIEHVI